MWLSSVVSKFGEALQDVIDEAHQHQAQYNNSYDDNDDDYYEQERRDEEEDGYNNAQNDYGDQGYSSAVAADEHHHTDSHHKGSRDDSYYNTRFNEAAGMQDSKHHRIEDSDNNYQHEGPFGDTALGEKQVSKPETALQHSGEAEFERWSDEDDDDDGDGASGGDNETTLQQSGEAKFERWSDEIDDGDEDGGSGGDNEDAIHTNIDDSNSEHSGIAHDQDRHPSHGDDSETDHNEPTQVNIRDNDNILDHDVEIDVQKLAESSSDKESNSWSDSELSEAELGGSSFPVNDSSLINPESVAETLSAHDLAKAHLDSERLQNLMEPEPTSTLEPDSFPPTLKSLRVFETEELETSRLHIKAETVHDDDDDDDDKMKVMMGEEEEEEEEEDEETVWNAPSSPLGQGQTGDAQSTKSHSQECRTFDSQSSSISQEDLNAALAEAQQARGDAEAARADNANLLKSLEEANLELGKARETTQQLQADTYAAVNARNNAECNVENLKQLAEQSSAEIAALQSKLESLEKEKNGLSSLAETATTHVKIASLEEEKVRKQVFELQAELEQLKKSHNTEIEELQIRHQGELCEIERSSAEKLNAAVTSQRESDSKMSAEAKRYEVELRNNDSEETSIEARISDAVERASKKHREAIQELRQSLETDKIRALEALREEMENSMEEVKVSMSSEHECCMQALTDKFEAQEATLQNELDQLQKSHASECDKLRHALDLASHERDLLREQTQRGSDTENEISILRHRVEELVLENKELDELNQRVETEKNMLKSAKEKLGDAYQELEDKWKKTLRSHDSLQEKCQEYEEILLELEDESRALKENLRESSEEKEELIYKIGTLEKKLEDLSRGRKEGASKISTQHQEIERLKEELEDALEREATLREDLSTQTGQHQQVHRLTAELKVTQAELKVAETDLDRLRSERETLNAALAQLNTEVEQRARVYKRKIEDLKREVQEQRTTMEKNKENFDTDRVELAKEAHESRLAAAAADRTIQVLRAEVDALKRAEEDWTNSQDAARRQELQRQQSSELDPSGLEEIEKTVEGQQQKSPREQSDDDGRVDREMMKKLVVTYFVQKQTGSYQSQRELLTLLANLLNMGESDREALGLILPRRSSSGSLFGNAGASNIVNGDKVGLLKKVLFGGEQETGEQTKRETDWEAIEKAVTVKPFTELWQDFLSQDL